MLGRCCRIAGGLELSTAQQAAAAASSQASQSATVANLQATMATQQAEITRLQSESTRATSFRGKVKMAQIIDSTHDREVESLSDARRSWARNP